MRLLEREAELRALAAAWAEAREGAGRVALVGGEAGIGKTALVEAFARGLAGAPRVLWGACDALFTPRPFGPLHDFASQLDGPLAALLGADGDRTAIFTAMLSALHARPIVVVFEDVHWADEATLDLLKYLGRRIQRTRALLILTYRDDELGPMHPLRMVLGDMATASAIRRIALPSLSLEAVRELAGERGGIAGRLHRQTGGNPFFVTEVLSSPSGAVPATARDAVLARTVRLSPTGRNVLRAAAVLGPRIEAWALAEMMGPDAQAVEIQDSGPFRPSSMETWAPAMLAMTMGMKSGETRSGPRSSQRSVCSTKVSRPPMPLPTITPVRARMPSEIARSASSTAIRAAATASWAKRSIRRATRRSMKSVGSKPRTWQAMVVLVSRRSKPVIVEAPLRPATAASQFASRPMPSEVTRPIPVTTVRPAPASEPPALDATRRRTDQDACR